MMKTLIPLLPLACATFLHGQTLELDKDTYAPGEPIVATWSGGPGIATDWIGLYRITQTPGPAGSGGTPSIDWFYVNGTKTATTGFDAGSVIFNLSGSGEYFAAFFTSDGYTEVAPRVFFTVTDTDISSFQATSRFTDGQTPVTLTWTIVEDGPPVEFLYIFDGVDFFDVLDLESLEVTPTANTTYTLDLNNGYKQAVLTVMVEQENTENFSIDQPDYFSGEPIHVSWSGAAGGSTDWIGIYRFGDIPGPASDLATRRSVLWSHAPGEEDDFTFHPNLPPGEYFICRFLNDGYDIEYGPIRFSIVPFRITAMQMTDDDITLTWTSRSSDFAYDIMESIDLEIWDYTEDAFSLLPAEGDARETSFTFPRPVDGEPARFYRVLRID